MSANNNTASTIRHVRGVCSPAGVADVANGTNTRRKAQAQVGEVVVCCEGDNGLAATQRHKLQRSNHEGAVSASGERLEGVAAAQRRQLRDELFDLCRG